MKKSNILIAAVVVIISAATAVKAEPNMDFDGKFKSQTLHDIFTNSSQLIPAAMPVPVETKLNPLGSACAMVCVGQRLTDDCRCEPYYPWPEDNSPIDWNSIQQYIQSGNNNYCVPVASGPWWVGCVVAAAPVMNNYTSEIPKRSFGEMSAPQKRLLGIQHILQQALKKAVIARSTIYKFSPEAEKFVSAAKTRILYDNKKVYITNGKMMMVIADEALIAMTKQLQSAVLRHMGDTTRDPVTAIIGGAGVIIGCMSNDNCWDAVGDTVSDITEWWVINVQDHTGDPFLNTPD